MMRQYKLLQTIFHNLSLVHSVQSKSKSLLKTGWNGNGKGTVSTVRHGYQTLLFTEQGSWRTANGDNFRFTNMYKWTLKKNSIAVAHLRQGLSHPVPLLELIPDGNALRSSKPHICKQDKYFARLTTKSLDLSLVWKVMGPKKNEHMEYLYMTDPNDNK